MTCRNSRCDNGDGAKGVCAPGDTPDYCIACDDARGGYSAPCKWVQPDCLALCGRTTSDAGAKSIEQDGEKGQPQGVTPVNPGKPSCSPVQCDRCGNTPCPGCNRCCGSTLGRDPDDGSCLGCG